MRLHDRYFFRELITPLFFLLGGFLIIGVSVFFTKELETIQEKRLDLAEAAAYCATSLPAFFVLILPMMLLLALLYALTHHARHNEITALRAAGVSIWRLCAPYFVVGLAATGVYFVLNEWAVPACDRWSEEILNRHVSTENTAKAAPKDLLRLRNEQDHRNWQFSDFDPRTGRMANPTVTWKLSDGSWKMVRADWAVWTNGGWIFYGVAPYAQSGEHGAFVPMGTNSFLAMPELTETPGKIRTLLKYADSRTLHGSGYADIPLAELWDLMRNQQNLRPEDANAVQTKFYGRLATPWECFVVVLVAIPFGAPSGRRNLFVGVAGSIFIGFAYFILQRFSLAFGMAGHLPGWLAAWLPNFVFGAMGIVLTQRVR